MKPKGDGSWRWVDAIFSPPRRQRRPRPQPRHSHRRRISSPATATGPATRRSPTRSLRGTSVTSASPESRATRRCSASGTAWATTVRSGARARVDWVTGASWSGATYRTMGRSVGTRTTAMTQGNITVQVCSSGPMLRPNGIIFSPDFKRCYVVDTGATDGPQYPANIIVFDVVSNGTALRGGKVFADFKPGFTDGIRCDTDGNVWCGWGWGGVDADGVRVHAPSGEWLAFLHTRGVVANLCFGGTKRNRLFMTGSTSIYALYVNAVGAALS